MKLAPLVSHLADNLPRVTDKFSDTVEVASIENTAGTAVVTTVVPHGLTTGTSVVIAGAKTGALIDIAETSISGNTVTFVTETPHNLIKNYDFASMSAGRPTVEIGNAGSFYDGVHECSDVPSKRSFIIEYSSAPPALAGTPQIYDGTGDANNGRFDITVIDPITFSYQVNAPESPVFGDIKVHTNVRVTGCITSEAIANIQTEFLGSDKFWVFVTDSNDVTSKDRNTYSDAIATRTRQVAYRMRVVDDFSCVVTAPASGTIAARQIHDELEDCKVALIKVLAGVGTPTPFSINENFQLVYSGCNLLLYDTAKVFKSFNFQGQYDITINDTILRDSFVSMKSIDYTWSNSMTAHIDLTSEGTE